MASPFHVPPDPQTELDAASLSQLRRALRESEERYRSIVDSAFDAVISIDHRSLITEFNPAAEAMFGWSRQQALGRDMCEILIPPALREAHRRGMEGHRGVQQPSRSVARMELSALHSSGAEFPIELTVSRVGGGSSPRFTAIIRNMTERRSAESEARLLAEHLKASESQYRSLFVGNPQPMFVYDPQTLRFLAVNAACVRQYGFTESEFLQMSLAELRLEDEREAWQRDILARPYRGQHRHEFRHRRKNGEIMEVEPLANDILFAGKPARVVIAIDVTQHRRAAAELRRSEGRFRALTELSADWFWEQDENLRFVDIQGGRYPMLVASYSQLVGKTRWEVPGMPVEGEWETHRAQVERHEPFRDFEVGRVAADGSVRVFSLTGSPIFDEQGRFAGYHGVGRDITERRRAQDEVARLNAELEERVKQRTAQLQAANAELEAFSYSIAHDLRSPLTSIDGFSHTLDEMFGKALGDQGRHYLNRIRAGVRHMSDLTDAMLSLARLSRVKLGSERVDLAELARSTLAQLREAQPQRELVLDVPEHLYAEGDPRLLAQVVANLLGNSWKFSACKPQTRISMGTQHGENGETVYFVADCGAGFDMAHASRLFGAFQRLHAPSEFEGTGIGLALVQKILSRHDGRIWAQARKGEGATFYFTLGDKLPV